MPKAPCDVRQWQGMRVARAVRFPHAAPACGGRRLRVLFAAICAMFRHVLRLGRCPSPHVHECIHAGAIGRHSVLAACAVASQARHGGCRNNH